VVIDIVSLLFALVYPVPKRVTWEEVLEVTQGPLVHPLLNDVETLASSAHDLVSYYSARWQAGFSSMPRRCRSIDGFYRCATSSILCLCRSE
jgi:hypothetical protein